MTTFASFFRSVGLVVAAIAWMIASPAVMAENPPAAKKHPLDPAIRQADSSLDRTRQIKDYQATMVKRERVGGKLRDYEYAYIRVRHEPFSMYMYLLAPANIRGCQVMYGEGRNDGKMIARPLGCGVTLAIKPDSPLAMRGSRYPITTVGIKNLAKAFAKRAQRDKELPTRCDVTFFDGTKINGRSTTMIQVAHSLQRKAFHLNHMARIYFDDDLNIPIRYEAYDFPVEEGGKPALLEEYTYLDVKVNNGFTDKDFDVVRKPSPTQEVSSTSGKRCRPVRFITNRGLGILPSANR